MFYNGLSTATSIYSSVDRKHRTNSDSDRQKKPYTIYGDGPNFAWTNSEINVLRNLTVEQHHLLSENSRDRKRNNQFCAIDGLQHRTFSTVYSIVCKLRLVSQRTNCWTESEDQVIRRITRNSYFYWTRELMENGRQPKSAKIKGLQYRTVNAVILLFHNLSRAVQESNIPPSSQKIILPSSTTAMSSLDISCSRSRAATPTLDLNLLQIRGQPQRKTRPCHQT